MINDRPNHRVFNKRRFFEDMGYAPHPGQLEIHLDPHPRKIVSCGVRWGKSMLATFEGLAAAMAPSERTLIWCVAPTFELSDRVFKEIEITVLRSLKHHVIAIKDAERRILLRNMGGGVSEIRGKSCDNPVSLLGAGVDLMILDEAARVKETVWTSFLSERLLDRNGRAILISTPKGKNWFWDLHRKGQGEDPDYQSWNCASWTSPLLDAEAIERERERLPERVFLQEYGAQFVEGAGQVFRHIRECATGEFQDPVPGMVYSAGVDLAKVADYSVVVVMNANREVVYLDRFNKVDWPIQIQRIETAVKRYRHAPLFVDSTGKGEPIHEALCRAGLNATAYPFSVKSKAALVDNLALLFEKKEIVIPKAEICPELVNELEAYEFSVTESGTVRTSAPSSQHDDCTIALCLAAWGVKDLGRGHGHYGVAARHREYSISPTNIWMPPSNGGFVDMIVRASER